VNSRIVIDANIALAWLFNENGSTAKLQAVFDASELLAPSLWLLEVTNAVLVHERRKTLTSPQALQSLQLLDDLAVDLEPEPTTRTATALAHVARPHQLTSYDAVYLDLAVRSGLPLLTRDGNLRAAAGRVGVPLVKG
jgi:predicted nucleic acid-binding protein